MVDMVAAMAMILMPTTDMAMVAATATAVVIVMEGMEVIIRIARLPLAILMLSQPPVMDPQTMFIMVREWGIQALPGIRLVRVQLNLTI